MPVGFLCNLEVVAGGIAFSVRRALVGSDVAKALGDRLLMDLGRAFVRGGRLVMAEQFTAVRLPVALVGGRGVLVGAPHVGFGDGLPGGKLLRPAQQLVGAPGGLSAR